jgi:hypothetical protein
MRPSATAIINLISSQYIIDAAIATQIAHVPDQAL